MGSSAGCFQGSQASVTAHASNWQAPGFPLPHASKAFLEAMLWAGLAAKCAKAGVLAFWGESNFPNSVESAEPEEAPIPRARL